eukprot:CAMPEP_0168462338 /NCGR_PEP_ID=MMETSP0228-20121227/54469_1 /TAXON_ID=133427 /ORGANISM="Protoceratium reticulatum, Strain CCCM 535 (=CCMP 1889)" /LENGTH=171 /DNA_ID=CAMNT_0008477721 /DNA_START=1 /DNA_END=513 /DNA_ORIENTATION=-
MAVPGRRVSRETPASSGERRGWQILREHWRDFLDKRAAIPDSIAADRARADASPYRPVLTKEVADRVLDKIIVQINEDSPRAAARAARWRQARATHAEVRAILGEPRNPHPNENTPLEDQPLAGMGYAASALFPTEWWKVLSPELLAELIVDAFSGTFCGALVDGGAELLE